MLNSLAIVIGDPGDAGNKYIALLVIAIASLLLVSSLRRKQRARARAADASPIPRIPADRPASPTADSKARLARDLELLIGELQDLSRKISAEIDTRFNKLEAAIRDADRRIAVLNRLSRGKDGAGAAESGEEPAQDVRYAIVYELADSGFPPVEIARDLGKTPGEIELILNLRRTAQK